MTRSIVGCSLAGCKEPASYKLAAPWSDGSFSELKTYGHACADHLGRRVSRGRAAPRGIRPFARRDRRGNRHLPLRARPPRSPTPTIMGVGGELPFVGWRKCTIWPRKEARKVPPKLPRKFTLSDAMVLIVATALGLTFARWWYNLPGYVNKSELGVQSISEMVAWFLLPFSPSLIVLQLRPPRPSGRRLFRASGFQANLAISLTAPTGLFTGHWGYKPDWSSRALVDRHRSARFRRPRAGHRLVHHMASGRKEIGKERPRSAGPRPGMGLDRAVAGAVRVLAELAVPKPVAMSLLIPASTPLQPDIPSRPS